MDGGRSDRKSFTRLAFGHEIVFFPDNAQVLQPTEKRAAGKFRCGNRRRPNQTKSPDKNSPHPQGQSLNMPKPVDNQKDYRPVTTTHTAQDSG